MFYATEIENLYEAAKEQLNTIIMLNEALKVVEKRVSALEEKFEEAFSE